MDLLAYSNMMVTLVREEENTLIPSSSERKTAGLPSMLLRCDVVSCRVWPVPCYVGGPTIFDYHAHHLRHSSTSGQADAHATLYYGTFDPPQGICPGPKPKGLFTALELN